VPWSTTAQRDEIGIVSGRINEATWGTLGLGPDFVIPGHGVDSPRREKCFAIGSGPRKSLDLTGVEKGGPEPGPGAGCPRPDRDSPDQFERGQQLGPLAADRLGPVGFACGTTPPFLRGRPLFLASDFGPHR
jgi:hypothetical protein